MDTHPYYRRSLHERYRIGDFLSNGHIDLGGDRHLPLYPDAQVDQRPRADALFDVRAAAVVASIVGSGVITAESLLDRQDYKGSISPIYILNSKSLAVMAYADFFPDDPRSATLPGVVSEAILKASPGWCGTFGPGVTGAASLLHPTEGNYDMNQMHLLPLAYGYYDRLGLEARERLIMILLARGRIQRPNEADTFTSGGVPNDWNRAGYVNPLGFAKVNIPETENHILMIQTVRYLSNQLLYQRDHSPGHDNRRNGDPGDSRPSCIELLLMLLQGFLLNDFAEYNAKPYQQETREALCNLCAYAYDAEVRLGARMVLDHISAHFAVSSNDLRRLIPFRRLNEGDYVRQQPGFMDTLLLDAPGGDPMAPRFALLAGNTRAYAASTPSRTSPWSIQSFPEYAHTVLTDYRIPPSIHDLFVNDLHRRFFQRLHRIAIDDQEGQRNCDNMEIFSASPSYLITAGGRPARWVISGALGVFGYKDSNIGVAMPTSFMATGLSAGSATHNNKGSLRENDASELIQLSRFSDQFEDSLLSDLPGAVSPRSGSPGGTENYGVAPDFACGYKMYKPQWVKDAEVADHGFTFVDKSAKSSSQNGPGKTDSPGFFLALHEDGDFAILEAFDTWLHPEAELTFEQFKTGVQRMNPNFHVANNQETLYVTQNGNRIKFVIWSNRDRDKHDIGSRVLSIEYGAGKAWNTLSDGGNDTGGFLNGTILNSPRSAVVEVSNPALGTRLILDMHDPWHPKRTSEIGEVQEAGNNHEVWVDFAWRGPCEGDFFHPFNTIAAAVEAVAGGGVIKIMPGSTDEPKIAHRKRVTLRAPIGAVKLGRQP